MSAFFWLREVVLKNLAPSFWAFCWSTGPAIKLPMAARRQRVKVNLFILRVFIIVSEAAKIIALFQLGVCI
jgi:hypothetical protein